MLTNIFFYRELYYVPASHRSIDPDHSKHMFECLDDTLQFIRQPIGTNFPWVANHWQFDTKLSLAKLIYIRFIYQRVESGHAVVTFHLLEEPWVLNLIAFYTFMQIGFNQFPWWHTYDLNKLGLVAVQLMRWHHQIFIRLEVSFIFLQALPISSTTKLLSTIWLSWISQLRTKCKNPLLHISSIPYLWWSHWSNWRLESLGFRIWTTAPSCFA